MLENAQAFLIALADYWWAIMVGIVVPLLLDVPKVLPDKWQSRISRWLPQPRKARLTFITGLIGLVVAAFLVFHDERTRHQKTQKALLEAKQYGILPPQLITIDESVKKNGDATYTIYKVAEVKARALPSLLEIRVEAEGIIDLDIDPIPTRTLFVRNPGIRGPDFITTSIPSPYGTYRFTVRAISDDFLLIHSFK